VGPCGGGTLRRSGASGPFGPQKFNPIRVEKDVLVEDPSSVGPVRVPISLCIYQPKRGSIFRQKDVITDGTRHWLETNEAQYYHIA
jgi:hypothetical protein